MKALVGVDAGDGYVAAVQWLIRLDFQECTAVACHAIEPVTALGPAIAPDFGATYGLDIARIERAEKERGEEVLTHAKLLLDEGGIPAETTLVYGHPDDELIRCDAEHCADLIAIGCEQKGEFGSAVFGSVSRSLTSHAQSSLIVAKTRPSERPIRAVFATDHSEYANRCLDELIRLAPKGITEYVVASAYQIEGGRSRVAIPGLTAAVIDEAERQITERNEAICERLSSLGASASSKVVQAQPVEGLRKVMEESGANLLIVGAKGHTALERFFVGSVTYRLVAESKQTMLVLRP